MPVTPTMLGASQAMRDMLFAFDFQVEDNQSHGPVWMDVTALSGARRKLEEPRRC